MNATVLGIDTSSYQPRDLTAIIADTHAKHVVVKAYQTIESIPQEHTMAQVASALANFCTVNLYVWLYGGVDPHQQVREAVELAQRAGLTLPILWIDCEVYQGTSPALGEALAACAACDALGVRAGIYTGNWFVRDYWGENIGELAQRPVWLASYDNNPTLDTPSPYWPVDMVLGHQYQGNPIDLDVFDVSVTTIAEPPPPTTGYTLETALGALGFASHDIPAGLETVAAALEDRAAHLRAIAEKLRTLSPT